MNILFIACANNPFSASNGGTQRSTLLLRALSLIADVDVISFCTDSAVSDGEYRIIHQEVWQNDKKDNRFSKFTRLLTPYKPDTMYMVDEHKEEIIDKAVAEKKYDFIVIRYVQMAMESGLWKYADKLVIDIDDNPVDRAFADAAAAKSLRNKVYLLLYARALQKALNKVIDQIHVAFVSNPDDVVNEKVTLLPNVPFYAENNALTQNEVANRLLFVGDCGYWANIQGVSHFLDRVYPIVQNEIPTVELHIVGRMWDKSLKEIWEKNEGVKVLGFVPSLQKEYEEAQVSVIPIYYGAGTCIKVLETMQMHTACVMTKKGFRGYDRVFESGRDCLVAETDAEFAQDIIDILRNETSRKKMIASAYQKQQAHYTVSAFNNVIAEQFKN